VGRVLIKTGPSSYVMDAYGLPKQQHGVQQTGWVYKRHEYLKSLSVAKRNFILTGDKAFALDPLPYMVIYNCFTYADIVRGPAPVQVIEPPQAVQNPVQVIPAPLQVIKPPQAVQNPVQVISTPIQIIEPPQAVQNLVQVIPTPAQVKTAIIVPTIVRQPEPEPQTDSDLADIPDLEDDSNPASPDPPTLLPQPLIKPQPQQVQPKIPVPPELQKVIEKAALQKKIVGISAKDVEQAKALKLHL